MPKRALRPSVEHRLVAAGLAVIAVTYGLARYGYGLYLPQFRATFGLSSGTAGAVAAGGYAGYCAATVVAGRLVGSARARAALWLAGGSAAAGCLLVAGAWSVPVLAVGALVAGSGAGAATPALVAAVVATVRPEAETRAQGVVNSGTGVGVVEGGLLVLTAPGSWRWSWAAFAVLSIALTWWADRSATWGSASGATAAPVSRAPGGTSVLRRLGRPLLAALLAGAGCAGVWTFGRDLLADQGGLPEPVTGLLWCVLGAAGLLGGGSGVLVAGAGLRRAWICPVVLAAGGTALLASRPGAPATVGQALGAVLLGVVAGGWGPRPAFAGPPPWS